MLCTSAAHMREHALPAFVRTLNARRLSSFSALIEFDLKFTCRAFFSPFSTVNFGSQFTCSAFLRARARPPFGVNPVQHLSNFSVFPNDNKATLLKHLGKRRGRRAPPNNLRRLFVVVSLHVAQSTLEGPSKQYGPSIQSFTAVFSPSGVHEHSEGAKRTCFGLVFYRL